MGGPDLCQHAEVLRPVWNLATAPPDERRAVLTALVLVPWVGRRLKESGFGQTRAWLADRHRAPASDAAVGRADRAMRRMPWTPRCLERSLVAWWLAGPQATIRFGVDPHGPRFHAWVERHGVVLNDTGDVASKYLPFDGQMPSRDRFDQ